MVQQAGENRAMIVLRQLAMEEMAQHWMGVRLKELARVRQICMRPVPADFALWSEGVDVRARERVEVDLESDLERQRQKIH